MSRTPDSPPPTRPLTGPSGLFAEFLGVVADAPRPHELLGIEPGMDATAVMHALEAALARIAGHPRSDTVEAGQVRAALHAAAIRAIQPSTTDAPGVGGLSEAGAAGTNTSRGLDPSLAEDLRRVIAANGGLGPAALLAASRLAAARGVDAEGIPLVIEAALLANLQAATRSQRPSDEGPVRIFELASPPPDPAITPRPRVAPAGATPAIPGLAAPGGASATTPSPRVADADGPYEVDPAVRVVRMVLVGGAVGVVALAAAIGLAIWVISRTPAPTPSTDAEPSVAIAQPTGAGAPGASIDASPAGSSDRSVSETPSPTPSSKPSSAARTPPPSARPWGSLVRDVRSAAESLALDRAAATQTFIAAHEQMSRTWTLAGADGRRAAIDATLEFLYRWGDSAPPPAMIAALAPARGILPDGTIGSAGELAKLSWSAGLLVRLSGERDLPRALALPIREALSATLPRDLVPAEPTFEAGAMSVLASLPTKILGPADAADDPAGGSLMGLWIEGVSAASGPPDRAARALIDALDAILTSGPEPTAHRGALDAVNRLVAALPWREGDDARAALLRWFDAPGITPSDLYAVTNALVTRSAASNVDATMVLAPGSADDARAEMRGRYATAWSLGESRPGDDVIARWSEIATKALAGAGPTDPTEALADALRLARLNTAATMLWAGDADSARLMLDAADDDPAPPTARAGPSFLDTSSGDTGWFVRYREAGPNVLARRELLVNFQGPPSLIESRLLLEEATRGSPAQVRTAALDALRPHVATPQVAWAALHELPLIAPTIGNNEILELITGQALPSPRSPQWRLVARRALVGRCLDGLAGAGVASRLSDLTTSLRITYALRHRPEDAARAFALERDGRRPVVPPIDDTARALAARWERDAEARVPTGAEPISPAEFRSRSLARADLAQGPVQRFAALQADALERMAFVVASRDPAGRGAIAEILREADAARASATHILLQIRDGERAILRVWLVRMGSAATTGDGAGTAPSVATPATGQGTMVPVIATWPPTPQASIGPWADALAALDPREPARYLELGEDIADAAWRDPSLRGLSIELLARALHLAATDARSFGSVGASAALALAEALPPGQDRTWLVSIARMLDPSNAPLIWITPTRDAAIDGLGLHAATVLGLLRAGETPRARTLLARPGVAATLRASDRVLRAMGVEGGASFVDRTIDRWPCPDCANTGAVRLGQRPGSTGSVRLCTTCRGWPGPTLSTTQAIAQLRAESWFLAGSQRTWAAQIAIDQGSPLRDANPLHAARALGVDASRTVFRDGRWVAP